MANGAPVGSDPKSQLLNFLQKKLERSVKKEDFTFVTTKVGDSYKSKVVLVCMNNQTSHGSTESTVKLAERSAAKAALAKFGSEVDCVKKEPGQPSNRQLRAAAAAAGEEPPAKRSKLDGKTRLIRLIGRILGGGEKWVECSEEDINITTVESDGVYVSTVTVPQLPGADENVFQGDTSKDAQEAKDTAINAAIEALQPLAPAVNRTVRLPMSPEGVTAKQELNIWVMKIQRGHNPKNPLGLTTTENDGKFTCSMQVEAFPGKFGQMTWKGSGSTQTEAEQEALIKAHAQLSKNSEFQTLVTTKPAKSGGGSKGLSSEGIDAKRELNNWVMKITRAPSPKGVLGLTTTESDGHFTCSMNISVFPGEFGQMTWEGTGSTKLEAEQEALTNAHAELSANEEFMELVNSKPSKENKPKPAKKSSGKGWGKGGGLDPATDMMWQMFQGMMAMNGFEVPSGNKGKSKGYSSNAKRERQAPSTKLVVAKAGVDKSRWVVLQNLPPKANEDHLRQLGGQISEVHGATIVSKGTGRLEFSSKQDAAFALPLLDGAQVGDNIIKASLWK